VLVTLLVRALERPGDSPANLQLFTVKSTWPLALPEPYAIHGGITFANVAQMGLDITQCRVLKAAPPNNNHKLQASSPNTVI
jgi:hypothetical protein